MEMIDNKMNQNKKNKRIVAVVVGTRGDVNPLVILGQELIRRGHDFSIMTVEKFRPLVEGKGVRYIHMDGDADHIMKYLVTDYKRNIDFLTGLIKLKRENPHIIDQTYEALVGADLCMYGTCSAFVRSIAEKLNIRCVRYFYSPYERTRLYSLYTNERNTAAVAKSYDSISRGVPLVWNILCGKWRKKNGLLKIESYEYYQKQNGENILTLFPVSSILMPRDNSWGDHVHVTGYLYNPEENEHIEEDEKLLTFIEGEKPIFVAFGKAESKYLAKLQIRMLEALNEVGIKTIVQADQIPVKDRVNTDRLYFVDAIPYGYVFPKVRAVVHHGGCTTNGLGIWAGCPTLVIPLALDQYFFGRRINELGVGPKPLYIRKRMCTVSELKSSLLDLVSGKYDKEALKLSKEIREENGKNAAANAVENYMSI